MHSLDFWSLQLVEWVLECRLFDVVTLKVYPKRLRGIDKNMHLGIKVSYLTMIQG